MTISDNDLREEVLRKFSSQRLLDELKRRGVQDSTEALLGELRKRGVHGSWLKTMRAANLSRLPRFGHGELRDPNAWGPKKWGCALAGEVGELCNVLKKYERQMPTDPSPNDLYGMVCEEIADVLTYLDLLGAWFDIDLARVTALKFNKVSQRHGFPERL